MFYRYAEKTAEELKKLKEEFAQLTAQSKEFPKLVIGQMKHSNDSLIGLEYYDVVNEEGE